MIKARHSLNSLIIAASQLHHLVRVNPFLQFTSKTLMLLQLSPGISSVCSSLVSLEAKASLTKYTVASFTGGVQ